MYTEQTYTDDPAHARIHCEPFLTVEGIFSGPPDICFVYGWCMQQSIVMVLPYNAHFLVDNSAASLDSHIIALSLLDDS